MTSQGYPVCTVCFPMFPLHPSRKQFKTLLGRGYVIYRFDYWHLGLQNAFGFQFLVAQVSIPSSC